MGKRFRILLLFISLSLSLSLMSNTYSRYIANTVGDLEVVFAKWQILVNDTDITNNNVSSISLVPVLEENENIKKNTIAPSSQGYFDIIVDPSNVDVSFDYSIELDYENENIPDLIVTKYAILDNEYSDGDQIDLINLNGNVIDGSLNYNNEVENFKHLPFTVRVYFEWYEGEDEIMDDDADTIIGTNGDNNDIQITASISFNQKIN